jgi:tripartite-type tricarboxylate transporter receptor subunit TctC
MTSHVLFRTVGALLAVTSFTLAGPAGAQNWPTKNVRVIIPFSAGSATDIVPRVVFEQVQANTGHTFVVENRPGAGFTIGVGAVKSAEPDGHTVLVHSNSFVTAPAIQAMNYDPVEDFSGITPLANVPMVLVVSPEKNIKTLKQLVDQAKAHPGSLNYAAAGIGSPPHLTMERFRVAAGFTGQLVPFKGAPEALTEVATGRVDAYFSPLAPAMSLIETGKLLPLAVSSMRRTTALPNVPTTTEAGYPNSDFDFYVGMFVPKQTPRDLVAKMHAETVKALESPAIAEKFAKIGAETLIMEPQAFDARIAKEAPIAIELAKAAGIGKT